MHTIIENTGWPNKKIIWALYPYTLPGPQRENCPGGTKVDTGLPRFIGAHELNHFLPQWV